jgi:hypothetical protein
VDEQPSVAAVFDPAADDVLNQQIADVFAELIKHAHDMGQGIATEFGLTGSDAMALFKLDAPMTMKELGLKMGCDPSYVTASPMRSSGTGSPGGNPRCGTGGARTSCSPRMA